MIARKTQARVRALALAGVLCGALLPPARAVAVQAAPPTEAAEAAFRQDLAAVRKLVQAARWRDAIDAAERLIAETEHRFGPESLQLADALDALGQSMAYARIMGKDIPIDPAPILVMGQRCLAIREKRLGRDHLQVAQTLAGLAVVHNALGNYQEPPGLWARALAIFERERGPDDPSVAWTLIGFGLAEIQRANYARANELYQRAAAIFEEKVGPDTVAMAASLQGQGLAAQRLGDVAEAERLFRRSLAINEKRLGSGDFWVSETLLRLADALIERGAYEEARTAIERALAIREQKLGSRSHHTANMLQSLANVQRKLGELDAARRTLSRALEVQEGANGPEHPFVAEHLQTMAEILADQGEIKAARTLAERALAIRESRLGMEHPSTAETSRLVANLLGDTEAALTLLERALKGSRGALGSFHPEVARTLRDRAQIQLRGGDAAGAAASAVAAEDAAREWLRLALRSLDERSALAAVRSTARGLDLAVVAASRAADPRLTESVFDAVVRSRALVLDELASRHRAARSASDRTLVRLEAELARSRERLARLALKGPGEASASAYRRLIEEARGEKEQAEAALAAHSRLFRETLDDERRGGDAVRAVLAAGDAVVSFVQFASPADSPRQTRVPASSYAAFVVRPGAPAALVVLGDAERIDRQVLSWRSALLERDAGRDGEGLHGLDAYRGAALELRAAVWDPLQPALRGAERVFLVPEGALHLVSFDALPAAGESYLIESGTLLHYLSAERDVFAPTTLPLGTGLLALGDPDFESDAPDRVASHDSATITAGAEAGGALRAPPPSCGALDRLRFARLPGSGREVDDLEARLDPGAALRLLRAAATEGAVKQQALGRRVLHLATHAFFLGEDCPSALSAASRSGEAPPGARAPLLRAGLALAGANKRGAAGAGAEDGLLTAEEIASLDLRGLEWAVLSACGTGVGEITAGEGVLGLSRAFRVAGAGTTIMSLWPVDDEATRRWMRALYRSRFEEGKTTAEAVHAAGLESLRERRSRGRSTHPFYWAGFIASGSWR